MIKGREFKRGWAQLGYLTNRVMSVEAELRAQVATAQLVRFDFQEPIANVMQVQDFYRLDLCLTPRPANARASYQQRWASHRFEPIGNLFLVPPSESMLALSDGCCQQASIVCELHPESMRKWIDDELQWTDQGLAASLDIRDRNIRTLLLRLVEEARNPGFASELLVELITGQIAIELARHCKLSNEVFATGGLAPWRLRLIDERLDAGLKADAGAVSAPPTLAELADLCRVSVRQLTRGFRESRGCSIGDYVTQRRVEQAKQLLATGESVKVIAYALGFSSSSGFGYAFRRATGCSPGQYRQLLRSA